MRYRFYFSHKGEAGFSFGVTLHSGGADGKTNKERTDVKIDGLIKIRRNNET